MFDVRFTEPPGFANARDGKFQVKGEFRMTHRYSCSKKGIEQLEALAQHKAVVQRVQALEVLPFRGRIGIAVQKGYVFTHGHVEAWNQEAEFRIDWDLMEVEARLVHFARQHPYFCQTIAVRYFPDVFPLH